MTDEDTEDERSTSGKRYDLLPDYQDGLVFRTLKNSIPVEKNFYVGENNIGRSKNSTSADISNKLMKKEIEDEISDRYNRLMKANKFMELGGKKKELNAQAKDLHVKSPFKFNKIIKKSNYKKNTKHNTPKRISHLALPKAIPTRVKDESDDIDLNEKISKITIRDAEPSISLPFPRSPSPPITRLSRSSEVLISDLKVEERNFDGAPLLIKRDIYGNLVNPKNYDLPRTPSPVRGSGMLYNLPTKISSSSLDHDEFAAKTDIIFNSSKVITPLENLQPLNHRRYARTTLRKDGSKGTIRDNDDFKMLIGEITNKLIPQLYACDMEAHDEKIFGKYSPTKIDNGDLQYSSTYVNKPIQITKDATSTLILQSSPTIPLTCEVPNNRGGEDTTFLTATGGATMNIDENKHTTAPSKHRTHKRTTKMDYTKLQYPDRNFEGQLKYLKRNTFSCHDRQEAGEYNVMSGLNSDNAPLSQVNRSTFIPWIPSGSLLTKSHDKSNYILGWKEKFDKEKYVYNDYKAITSIRSQNAIRSNFERFCK